MQRLFYSIIVLIFCGFKIQAQQVGSTETKIWSLQDCIAYAIDNNITVKDAVLGKSSAEVDYDRAKSSRLPNLNGSATQSLSHGNSIDPITSDYVSEQIHSTNLGISSSVSLFQGFQINNQIKQSKLLVDQNSFFVEVAKNNIELSVVQAYLQTLYSKEDIVISENDLIASEKEVERAKSRLDAGTIALNDYTDAQSQAATNKYDVITAKNNYEQQLLTLKQLLELGPMDTLEIESIDTGAILMKAIPDKMEVYKNALGSLPEISAGKLNIQINEKELDIAKGGYLPTLSLTGSIGSGYTSIDYTDFTDQLNNNFNQKIGLNLSIPIFNRYQTKAQVQTAKINIEKARLQLKDTEKGIYKNVETAWQNVLSSRDQLGAAEASREAAEESYRLAQKKYELGALNTTDLIISQNRYSNAQQNYIQAKYLSILYRLLLEFYQGNEIKL